MQRRGDLYSDLTTEVHVGDMTRGGEKAGTDEALQLAKIIAKDNGDAVVQRLPSPLVAQPKDLHAFLTGQLQIEALARSQPYPVIRGGAFLTRLGRVFIIEFKNRIDEDGIHEGRFGRTPILTPPHRTVNTTSPDIEGQAAMKRMNAAGGAAKAAKVHQQAVQKAETEALPQPGQTRGTYKVDPRVVGLTNKDEGSSTHVTIISRSPKLYTVDWNADQRFAMMRDDSSFHFNENTPIGKMTNTPFKPVTQQLYQKIVERVTRIRQNPAPAAPPQAAPAPAAAPPPRKKLFGFL